MIDISYRIFDLVASTNSLTKTAEIVHLTPSAVSHSLRKLEERLGMKLVVRNRDGLRLTQYGQELIPHVRYALKAEERLQQEIGVPDNAALGQGLYKVTADALNIRSGPGTENDITGVIEDRGVYTIVQIENGNWGRLLSGAGWICLEYAKKI